MTIQSPKLPEQQLLREDVLNQRPELLSLLHLVRRIPLTPEQRESLRSAIAAELAETSLDSRGEPNPRGRPLDNPIGRLGDV